PHIVARHRRTSGSSVVGVLGKESTLHVLSSTVGFHQQIRIAIYFSQALLVQLVVNIVVDESCQQRIGGRRGARNPGVGLILAEIRRFVVPHLDLLCPGRTHGQDKECGRKSDPYTYASTFHSSPACEKYSFPDSASCARPRNPDFHRETSRN